MKRLNIRMFSGFVEKKNTFRWVGIKLLQKISLFLDRILMEHIELICSLESKLLCLYVPRELVLENKILSKKPLHHISNPYVYCKFRSKQTRWVYMIRHGQYEDGAKDKDRCLSAKGREQARLCGKYLKPGFYKCLFSRKN